MVVDGLSHNGTTSRRERNPTEPMSSRRERAADNVHYHSGLYRYRQHLHLRRRNTGSHGTVAAELRVLVVAVGIIYVLNLIRNLGIALAFGHQIAQFFPGRSWRCSALATHSCILYIVDRMLARSAQSSSSSGDVGTDAGATGAHRHRRRPPVR